MLGCFHCFASRPVIVRPSYGPMKDIYAPAGGRACSLGHHDGKLPALAAEQSGETVKTWDVSAVPFPVPSACASRQTTRQTARVPLTPALSPPRSPKTAYSPSLRPKGRKPLREYRRRAEAWCSRHHVADSHCNDDAPRQRRAYFDELPRVTVRGGYYEVGHDHPAPESYSLESAHHRLNCRLARATPDVSREVLSRAGARAPVLSKSSGRFSSLQRRSAASSRVEQVEQPGGLEACASPQAPGQLLENTTGGPSLAEASDEAAASEAARRAEQRAKAEAARAQRAEEEAKARLRIRRERYHFTQPHLDFAEWCDKKHGGLSVVWRRLDVKGKMSLTKADFLKGFKTLQYMGSSNDLWLSLDRDKTGMVSFTEFDPEDALVLARFKHWVELKFVNIDTAFKFLDTEKNGSVSYREFERGCSKERLPPAVKDSLKQIFQLLDNAGNKATKGNITVEEIAFLESWKCPPYLWQEPDHAAKEQFVSELIARHRSNPLLAWRKALDKDGSMKVTYDEFVTNCKEIAQSGVASAAPSTGLPALYCAFDTDRSGWFTFRDWDEPAFRTLAAFSRRVAGEFGRPSGCVKAWEKEKGAGVGLGAFNRHTEALGLSAEDRDVLFEGLSLEKVSFDSGAKKGKISHQELVFLDSWEFSDDLVKAGEMAPLETGRTNDVPASQGPHDVRTNAHKYAHCQ